MQIMSEKFQFVPLCKLWVLHRQQVLDDLQDGRNGHKLEHVWVTTGHVFVLSDVGTKLFTFDIKPISMSQNFSAKSYLDLATITPPLLDILYSQRHDLYYLVHKNGHMQVWQFNKCFYIWEKKVEYDLCNGLKTELVSVVYHGDESALYWCEKRASSGSLDATSYCICKRILKRFDEQDFLGRVLTLLHNCPPCDLQPLAASVYIQPRNQYLTSKMPSLLLDTKTNMVTVLSDHEEYPYSLSDSGQVLDFRTVLLAAVQHIDLHSGRDEGYIVEALYHHLYKCIVSLNSNGHIEFLNIKNGSIVRRTVKLTDVDEVKCGQCFVWKDMIGVLAANELRLYNLTSGAIVGHLRDESFMVSGMRICKAIGQLRTTVFASRHGLVTLQRCVQRTVMPPSDAVYAAELMASHRNSISELEQTEAVCKSYIEQKLPESRIYIDRMRFQNPALPIVILDQLADTAESLSLNAKRLSIKKQYKSTGSLGKSQYSEIVGEYVKEHFRLEEVWQELLTGIKSPETSNDETLEKEISNLLRPNGVRKACIRQAALENLAEKFPSLTLATIMKELEVQYEDLTAGQLQRWLSVLGVEDFVTSSSSSVMLSSSSSSAATSSNSQHVAFPLFELICRLMFCEHPSQLVKFVKVSQLIHDRSFGASAFMRRKQTWQFYERGLACLPAPEKSTDIDQAVIAMVKLIWAVEADHSSLKALKLLCQYHLWDRAVRLLQEKSLNISDQRDVFSYLTKAMTKDGVLSHYITEVLQCVPDSMSLSGLLALITVEDTEQEGDQPIKAWDVFVSDESDVRVGNVRDVFIALLEKSENAKLKTDPG